MHQATILANDFGQAYAGFSYMKFWAYLFTGCIGFRFRERGAFLDEV